jgi:tyrosine-specific transport protein
MNAKLIGGIFLIVGTAIGGGMLALPIASAEMGFVNSSLFLFISWLIMTAGAFLILEVNLWLPANSNLISMTKVTLGKSGQIVAWIIYLLLFYSLVAAYIAGGSDFLHNLITKAGLPIPSWVAAFVFTFALGFVVYRGIQSVDYVNRGLMFTKLGVYIFLVAIVLMFISPTNLIGGDFKYVTTGITVMLTSFGFATIIPSLRSYFNDDVKKLRAVILIGSLIPLLCYILWDLVIMSVIPRSGTLGLIAMLHSAHSTSDLTNTLSGNLNTTSVTILARIFTSICLATSFLGVSLGLSDFLADGLKIRKEGRGNLIVGILTFLPPLAIVLIDQRIFISALSYAGIYCIILLVLLPALMAWQGRYRQKFSSQYQFIGGKPLLIVLIFISLLVIAQGLMQI